MHKNLTARLLRSLRPSDKDYFVRDTSLTGFGVKVAKSGRVTFIVERRIKGGKSRRLSLGQFPQIDLETARRLATDRLSLLLQGINPRVQELAARARTQALQKTLREACEAYLTIRDLKQSTSRDYSITIRLVFSDWLDRSIRQITRADIETRYLEIRDSRGLATANKAMRILSAIFNSAMADEVEGERLLKENPCDVLKQKRMIRQNRPRARFLDESEIDTLVTFFNDAMDWPETPAHGVTKQGIRYVILLMCTGLRKSEGFGLRWEDVNWSKKLFTVKETKNDTDHVVPMSSTVAWILTQQKTIAADSPWVFPAARGDGHMTEPKSQLQRIKDATGLDFMLHDLRRTFATHAQAQGMEFELIRRALNHKTGAGVTGQYIITQVETLRPVFQAVADGYHTYYDPTWRIDDEPELEPVDTVPMLSWTE